MIISQNINQQTTNIKPQYNTGFTSHSAKFKKADNVCRKVMNELPDVYSNTRLFRFDTLMDRRSTRRLFRFTCDLIDKSRTITRNGPKLDYYLKNLAILKKHHIGNCHEMADASYIALKMNGYEDAKVLWLYAYNPKRKYMRDLDHVVAGINFRVPDNYEYNTKNRTRLPMPKKYRIMPQNDSIIVDSWAGFSEYGKKAGIKYDRKDILLALTADRDAHSLLRDGEQLCFVPEEPKDIDGIMPLLKEQYPELILGKKQNQPLNPIKDTGLSDKVINRYRVKRNMKAGDPEKCTFLDRLKNFAELVFCI